VAVLPLADAVPDDPLLELPRVLVVPFDFLDEVELVTPLMTLGALGVGVVVQYHLPFAKAQAWPSLAVL
jgi:hypothetical protein